MNDMTTEAKEARRAYQRAWREKNREHDREYHKAWRESHKDQVKATNHRYWEKRAKQMDEASSQAVTAGEGKA